MRFHYSFTIVSKVSICFNVSFRVSFSFLLFTAFVWFYRVLQVLLGFQSFTVSFKSSAVLSMV